jgi:hypothetical protein
MLVQEGSQEEGSGVPAQGTQTTEVLQASTVSSSLEVQGSPSSQACVMVFEQLATGVPIQGVQMLPSQLRMVSVSNAVQGSPSSQGCVLVIPTKQPVPAQLIKSVSMVTVMV